jgi:putative ABC transport system permease protein
MVTPAALTRFGARVGDTLTLTQPRAGTFTIVGTMRDLTQASSYQELFARPAALDGVTPNKDLLGTSFYLPNLSLDWTQVRALNHDGITTMSRQVYQNPPKSSLADNSQNISSAIQSASLITPLLAFSLFEVALLAGAAFTVGAAKQQRSLATLASVGGDRRTLARVVSAAGIVLGLAGGIAGAIVGIAGAWAFMRVTADGSISQYPGFHVDPLQTGFIIVFAVAAGWIASLVPARRASRLDVVGALRGSLRPRPPSKKTPIIGAIIGVAGIAATVAGAILLGVLVAEGRSDPGLQHVVIALIIIGPILLQVAALTITPLILRAFSRLLARAGTAARLAARDTARNASRSVPAIGAIMSTIFIASFVITYLAASQAEQTADYEYATAAGVVSGGGGFGLDNALTSTQARDVAASMNSILHVTNTQVLYASEVPDPTDASKATGLYPVAALNPAFRCTQLSVGPGTTTGPISIASANCQGPEYLTFPADRNHIFVGSTAGIEIAIGEKLSAAARSELAAGGVVSFYPEYVRRGAVTLDWVTGTALGTYSNPRTKPVRTTTLPAVEQTPKHAVYVDIVMSPATAKAAGIHYVPSEFVARTKAPLSDAQRDSLNSASQAITRAKYPIDFRYESGPPTYAGPFQWGLLALCALITIGSASVAIGLARSEGRRDEAVLGSLGASPRLRRAHAFWGAGLITGVGSIAGVLLGTIPALAVAGSLVQEGGHSAVPFTVPWLPLLIAALGLPLLLSVGGWITAGRSRIRYLERAPIE